MFWTFVIYAAIFILTELFRPKPKLENARPADLGDFRFPTATEGRSVPLVWGTVKLTSPNVVWYGDFTQEAIRQKVKTGLFSSATQTVGYQYHVGIQMALCRGPVGQIRRVWIGDEVVHDTPLSAQDEFSIDRPDLFGGNELGMGGVVGDVEFYVGDEVQAPDPYLAAFQDPTPGYRGTSYVVFKGGYIGNTTQIAPWSFEIRRIPNGLNLAVPGVNDGADANPMNVIFEILTNSDWGLGLPEADIDAANFAAAAGLLRDEGNGFSMVLDVATDARELLDELQRQIDGLVYVNPHTGLWQVRLARDGQSVVMTLDDSNVLEIRDYAHATWKDTVNQVRTPFDDRGRDYFRTNGFAQDSANLQVQGVNVSTDIRFPGVKDADLANALAWRELRELSFPLAKTSLIANREAYALLPGDVVQFTNTTLGISEMRMRVASIDYGTRTRGQVELTLVQDVFVAEAGAFSPPPATHWVPPLDDLQPIPEVETVVLDAPFAIARRDPDQPGVIDRLWVGARNQRDGAVNFDILQRNSASTPIGSFSADGTGTEFVLIGELQADLEHDSSNPVDDVVIDPDPDTLPRLAAALVEDASLNDVGAGLVNLFKVGDEFIAARTFSTAGGVLTLDDVFRGLLDTAPALHLAGEPVFLLRGALSETPIPRGNNVHVKVQTTSRSDTLPEGDAPQINFTMEDRARRPYPPVEPTYNGTRYADEADVDAGPANLDARRILVGYRRRDWRNFDEVVGLGADAASFIPDFPTANNTRYALEVRDDPDGANTLLFGTDFEDGNDLPALRKRILRFTGGEVPDRIRIIVWARHTLNSENFDALQGLAHDLDVLSDLRDQFLFGVLAFAAESEVFTLPVTSGTLDFEIGTALPSGAVQARVNNTGQLDGGEPGTTMTDEVDGGDPTTTTFTAQITGGFPQTQFGTGAWEDVIVATEMQGDFEFDEDDSVQIRHTQSGSTDSETFLQVQLSAEDVAYAILTF